MPKDAVFIANEQQALGFLAAADEYGVRVPDRVAIMCFNGTTNAEYSIPALSTVEQPVEEIAAHAVALLRKQATLEPVLVVCDFRLVPRRSCGCVYSRTRASSGKPASIGALA